MDRRSWVSVLSLAIGSMAVADAGSRPPTNSQHEAGWRGHASEIVADSPMPDPAVMDRHFADGHAWIIDGGLAWGIGLSDAVVFVPHGFVHARENVPPVLWSAASYTRAAVVHDYLYWAQPCTRLQADNLLMIAMKEAGVPWLKRQWVYRTVRLQGEATWHRNARERALGVPRFNPYGGTPAGTSWPQLRAKMFRDGVRDIRYQVPDGFCRHGDSQDVPEPAAPAPP